jgi:diketogulonate reductase-like aldo/keto reductase
MLMKEAEEYLNDNTLFTNQVKYSLQEQSPRGELLKYCKSRDILLTGYSPLGKGELARPGYKVLDTLSDKYGKTQSQVALNWLISQDQVITIPKASSKEHLEENLGALGWSLTSEDQVLLSKSFE